MCEHKTWYNVLEQKSVYAGDFSMDVSMRLEAVEAARDLLRRFRIAHPAWQDDEMLLEEIANWLGCEIATFHPEDYPTGTYGFLEPGEPLIWLCRDLPSTLRRFTLAHELGHVVLHSHISTGHDLPTHPHTHASPIADVSPDDPCLIQDVCEELTGLLSQQQAEELLGPGLAYDPRSQRELAANLFAAELLMPLEYIWEHYVVQGVAPEVLAAHLHVSQAALFNRLTGLLTERPTRVPEVSAALLDENNELPAQTESVEQRPAPATKTYDAFQQAAIEASTPALVVAGPGSGKTSTLIGRAEYLLHQQGVHPQDILALTFSRKAAQEMQERLKQILPAGLIAPTISTFHAFCAELLRTHGQRVGLRPGFVLVDDAEGYFLLQAQAAELRLNHYQNLYNPASPFRDFLRAISRAKDELITPARYRELASEMHAQAGNDEDAVQAAERALEVAAVYELYQRGLEQRGDSDFGGLLMLAVQLLTEHADIRAEVTQRYQHILVDEFQDINRASGVLLRLLAGEQQRVWVVGDANQAIYGFRGASPANISQFHEDYPNAVVLPLNRNYRSRPDIVRVADTFKSAHLEQDARVEAVQTARAGESDPYITLAVAPNEGSELRGLVRDIQQKLAEGYRCSEIVVLCRTRAMARKVTRELARAELPVSARGGMIEQEHTKNLISLLLLLADPSGMGILRAARIPAHPLSQIDIEALLLEARTRQTTLLSLILREETPLAMSAAGARPLSRLATIMKNLLQQSTSVWALLARYLLQETSLVRDLLAEGESDQARAMGEDYANLLQVAHTYDQRQQELQRQAEERARERGEEPPPAPEIKAQIADFLAYLQIVLSLRDGSGEAKREEQGEEAPPEVLRVMTVHASKGLEFPVVYLPGLAQRRFPLQKRYNATPPPTGMLPAESDGNLAHESGEACLFYVGATRARDQLILSHSERYGKQKAKRSGYVDALVVGLPDERVQRVLWRDEAGAPTTDTEADDESMPLSQPSQAFIEAAQPATLKASQIEDYLTCPRRYAYSTVYRFQPNSGDFLAFWQTTHETVKTLLERVASTDQPISSEAVAELFQHHWHASDGESSPFAHLYEQHGLEVAEQVRRQLLEQSGGWQLRQSLSVEVAEHTIEVTIDRIESPAQVEQPAKFVRTRFGKSKGKPTAGIRELLYLHAQRQHHPGQQVTLHTHNLSTGETREITIATRKEEGLQDDLVQAIEGIERQDFTPRPDAFVCASCPFFLVCPA
jgi:superfamily I DNA/RNA helicase/Zn-dependent peptidase ImmA (M78 family)/CRISPR/Cas system-associated exonuclease Cas4 (RecB family)